MITDKVVAKFRGLFNINPELYSSPGRINLIGEHTDYNDGFVLPAAIDKAIYFGMATNTKNKFRFYSLDFNEYFETDEVSKKYQGHWASYLMGVLAQFQVSGIELSGIDCVFGGDIPIGAGLSSSAAIECGFAFGLNEVFNARLSKYKLALMSQKAEHEYAGVMCGIMDQYASMFGKKDHVLRLDCRTHEHEYYHLDMKELVIALCDTGVKHKLVSSGYNTRREECEAGVRILQKSNSAITALRDADINLLEEKRNLFDPVTYKRCLYVVNENERVQKACSALIKKDFGKLGKLMYQSHAGLQHQYEVSCKELDMLVEFTREMDYVYGSRMMGGGFGGCTINLLKRSHKEEFRKRIDEAYRNQTEINPAIYFVSIADGTKVC